MELRDGFHKRNYEPNLDLIISIVFFAFDKYNFIFINKFYIGSNKLLHQMKKPIHHPSIRVIVSLTILFMIAAGCNNVLNSQYSRQSGSITHSPSPLPRMPVRHINSAPRPVQSTPATTPQPKPSAPQVSSPVVTTPDAHIPPVVDGLAPVIYSIPTKQPVVFLGIDDGGHKSADELQMMNDNHVKASLFLSRLFIQDNPSFFADFVNSGNLIEDHSLNHYVRYAEIESYALQKQEICGMADYIQEHYGRRPIFFRPPGGAYSVAMRKAAADCGMRAIVTWIAKANSGAMQYQIGNHLRPGDIVLMHFRPEFRQDIQAFLDAMNAAHLHTELLENWF